MTAPAEPGQHTFARTPVQRLMLHAPNPLVRLILRSPAHRLLSGRLLLLTYTGRRSGSRYTIPVAYARAGDDLGVVVGFPERKLWWRNLREPGTRVTLTVGGDEREAVAAVHESPREVTVTLHLGVERRR